MLYYLSYHYLFFENVLQRVGSFILYGFIIGMVVQKNRMRCVCIYMCMYVWRDWDWEKLRWELGIYFKELAHMVVEAWQVRNLQGKLVGWDPGKGCSLSPEAVCWQSSFLLEVVSLFLLKPSSDQIWVTHVMESNLFI